MIQLAEPSVSAILAMTNSDEEKEDLRQRALSLLNEIEANAQPIAFRTNQGFGMYYLIPKRTKFGSAKIEEMIKDKYEIKRDNRLCVTLAEAGEGVGKKIGFFPSVMTGFAIEKFEDVEPNKDSREIIRELFELFAAVSEFEGVKLVTRAAFLEFRNQIMDRKNNDSKKLSAIEKTLRSSFPHPLSLRRYQAIPREQLP